MPPMLSRPLVRVVLACGFSAAMAGSAEAARARGPTLPEIRVATAAQAVPSCVTPERLMRQVMERTRDLDPRFRDIARYYKQHGEALRVRWDYAFYQMLIETNYLSYKTGSGRWGDVDPRQNNFAGIGTTGGGVPGDSFPDVSTGVLAQMQHLIAYSGERVPRPVAPRTREKQDEIVALSLALHRPVRFDDLTNRWAKDSSYAKSIEWAAERYRQANCTEAGALLQPTPQEIAEQAQSRRPRVATQTLPKAQRSAVATRGAACDVFAASYGGPIALLIRSTAGSTVNYTVLQVEEALEQPQADAFMKAHTPNGQTIARFGSREEAVARAFQLCPGPS
jgi:Mannosyl-glycoprotein endo-beta-N-acetylglucosaminidase